MFETPIHFQSFTQPARVTVESTWYEICLITTLELENYLLRVQLYRLDMRMMHLVNNFLVQTFFVANQQSDSQVLLFHFCNYSGLADTLKVWFFIVLARQLFATQAPTVHPAFINLHQLWNVTVSDFTDDVLKIGHEYKHGTENRPRLAIAIQTLRLLTIEQATATCKHVQLWRISDGTANHAPFDELNYTRPVTQFLLPLLSFLLWDPFVFFPT